MAWVLLGYFASNLIFPCLRVYSGGTKFDHDSLQTLSSTAMSSEEIAKAAKDAFEASRLIPSAERVAALESIRQQLELQKAEILAANAEDLKVCVRTAHISPSSQQSRPHK